MRDRLAKLLSHKKGKQVAFVLVYASIGVVFASLFTFAQLSGDLSSKLSLLDSQSVGAPKTQVKASTEVVDVFADRFNAVKSMSVVNGSIDVFSPGFFDMIVQTPQSVALSDVPDSGTVDLGTGDLGTGDFDLGDIDLGDLDLSDVDKDTPTNGTTSGSGTAGSGTAGSGTAGSGTNTPVKPVEPSYPDAVYVNGVQYSVMSPTVLRNAATSSELRLTRLSSSTASSSVGISFGLPVSDVIYTVKDSYLEKVKGSYGTETDNQGVNLEVYQDSFTVYSMQTGVIKSLTRTALGTRVVVENVHTGIGTIYEGVLNLNIFNGDDVQLGMALGACSSQDSKKSPQLHIEVYSLSGGSQIMYDPERLNYTGI